MVGMVLPWTNEMKVTLDDIVSARGQSNSLFLKVFIKHKVGDGQHEG